MSQCGIDKLAVPDRISGGEYLSTSPISTGRASYSHRGRYYTLDELAHFDEFGLWSNRDVWFSMHGTLLSTAAAIVPAGEAGYFGEELDHVVRVATKDVLRKLVHDRRLGREKLADQFSYCAAQPSRRVQQRVATVTVAHYPPGTSKWNSIEHRLFSELSKNWAGRPLDTLETILRYARTTATTGLRVRAQLVRRRYHKGVKISDAQMCRLAITTDDTLPRWNYTRWNYTIGPA